ncbi:MAG TPA: choice-of-anchor B family protein [Jiangellaceae bacterium]
MRTRWSVLVLSLVITTALVATPALADDDDHSGKYDGVTPQQWTDFDSVAENASEGSNAPLSFAPCIDGMAADMFPCDGVDLMSFVPHGELGTDFGDAPSFGNDIWGWTDPQTKHDYALMGSSVGTVFVDITDPKRPDVLGLLPTHSTAGGDFWRDIKVYADHAFITSENLGHGMQVFDLTELRDWDGTYTTYEETAHYDGIATAHNVAINEDTGFAYVVGARNLDRSLSCGGGLHMVDVTDPTNPSFAGCFGDNGYVHDTQCVIYEGPDAEHRGKEICFNSNAPGAYGSANHWVDIVDVTDKSNPVSLGRMSYPNSGYSHQGWLTPDQQYFLHGDEGDEFIHGLGTTTRVWDVRDLDNPTQIGTFENGTSIDHNIYTEGRVAYASNYTSGLRVYDTRNVAAGELSELAYFDVYPENDNASFEGGTWSNYAYFHQKNIVAVSSIDRGLFILKPRGGLHNN